MKRTNSKKQGQETFKLDFDIEISPPSEEYFKTNWTHIERFLNSLYKISPPENFCYLELFRKVEDICIDRLEDQLHKELKAYYKRFFERELASILKKDQTKILDELEVLWIKITSSQQIVSEVLIWFERTCLLKTRVKTIEKLIIAELLEQFEQIRDVRVIIIQQIIKHIMLERAGEKINRQQIKNVVDILIKLDYYRPHFEPELLKLTQQHYKIEAQQSVENFEVCSYLNRTQQRINQEQERVHAYLEKSTEPKIVSMLEKLFVDDYLQKILSEGFDFLVNNQKLENLKQLYTFLNKLGRIDFLKNTWQYYIKQKGSVIINAQELGVEPIIEFKRKLDEILINCFDTNYALKTAMQYAFEDFINIKTNKIAELTTKYFDNILQKAHKLNQDEEHLEKTLDDTLAIFKFLAAKDIFEAFYTKRLMRRLLLRNVSSFELEKKLVEKFKAECGSQFTKKSEDIFVEFEISKSLHQDFMNSNLYSYIQSDVGSLEFHVNVFSTNSWPLKNHTVAKFPFPLDKIIQTYAKFYTGKFAGVTLFWQFDTSTCEVIGYYPNTNQTYTFQVSLLQAIILLMFNTNKAISAKEIEQLLAIDFEDLKLNLVGLYSPQSFKDKTDPILFKEPAEGKLVLEDVYTLNDNFSSKLKRVKVNQAQKREAKEEIEQTTNRVLQERQYLLDACIVKIMKGKRTLTHNDLINEVFNSLKLPIQLPEIKKRIESLIERDYLERDKDNMQMYHYVA